MFLYAKNRFNPDPELTLTQDPNDDSKIYLEHLGAPICLLPSTFEDLKARQKGKFWANVARRKKRFLKEAGPIEFAVLSTPDEIRPWLERTYQLFQKRWGDTYTSSEWITPEGFAEYAESLLDLSDTSEASLAILHSGDELLSFGYNLMQDHVFAMYQHLADPRPEYRKYGLGKIFLSELLRFVVETGKFWVFDFMIGEADYKKDWANRTQKVYLEIDRNAFRNRALCYLACLKHWAHIRVMKSPTLKGLLKKGVILVRRLRLRT